MTEQKPTLNYKIVVVGEEVHIYAGVFAYGGRMPAELVIPDASFLSEKLTFNWGTFDRDTCIRYRICLVRVQDPDEIEMAVANKIECIKAEWKQLLERSARQAKLAKFSIPEWTELV